MATEPTTPDGPNETVVLADALLRDFVNGARTNSARHRDAERKLLRALNDAPVPHNVHFEAELVLRWRCPGVAPADDDTPDDPLLKTARAVGDADHYVVAARDAERYDDALIVDGHGRVVDTVQLQTDPDAFIALLNDSARFLWAAAARHTRSGAIDEERARAAAEHRRALVDLARHLLDLAATANTESDAVRFAETARVTLGRTPGEHLVRELIADVDKALGREQFARPTGTLNRTALDDARARASSLLASLGGYR